MSRIEEIKKELNISFDYSKLDFNHPITREHLDMEVYNNKFKFVDKVNAMKNPNPLYLKIIDYDTTMRTYMFVRLNTEPLEFYPYQDLISNDKHRYRYFRAANQNGKLLSDDTLIPTTNGFKKNGDLKVGDMVFGRDGKSAKILKTFHNKDWELHKFTFDDEYYMDDEDV